MRPDEVENITDNLPHLEEGEHLPVTLHEITKHHTKPKPLFTEATLLSAMEAAGKDVDDEEARAAMKDCGIGTPATRASIIETLLTRGYIEREKKTLVPTEKGQTVYEAVKEKQIADALMTGTWEAALSQIESGKLHPETFNQSILIYAGQITRELLEEKYVGISDRVYVCPLCQKESVYIFSKIVKCTDENCDFKFFRPVCGKHINEDDCRNLLLEGKTGVIRNMVSKKGKVFHASVVLNPDGTTSLQFDNYKKKGRK